MSFNNKPQKTKVFAQNEDKVEFKKPENKQPKCPFHESHDRHCVDCNKKV